MARRKGWLKYSTDDHHDLSDIDGQTRAYSLIPGDCSSIWKEEPNGSVPEDEYEVNS